MRHGDMSRSAKDRQTSGRQQHSEEEPFIVDEITRSPIMRGRRQNSEDERFTVENMSSSPVLRGRRENSEEECLMVENIPASPIMRGRKPPTEEPFLVQNIPRSPVMRGRAPRSTMTTTTRTMSSDDVETTRNVPGWNLSSDMTDESSAPNVMTTSTVNAVNNRRNGPPDNDDAPPSYESSVPPNHIGWSPNVTATIPFPMPLSIGHNDEKLTFTYPSSPYPPIELSPLAKSYLSIESPNSRSPGPSITPSPSPSPDRLRPAYTYQQRAIRVVRTPNRPQFRREYGQDDGNFAVKPHNEFSYRYGGVIIAIFFVIFMMLLSLAVKFLIRNSFNQ